MSDNGAQSSLADFTLSPSQLLKQAIKYKSDSLVPPPGYNQNSVVPGKSHTPPTMLGGVEQMSSGDHLNPHHLSAGDRSQMQFSLVEENPADSMLEAWLFPVR